VGQFELAIRGTTYNAELMRPNLKAQVVKKAPLRKAVRLPYDYGERLSYLFRRDGGICQLCHQPVDWNLRGASIFNVSRPTIDHIEAKSKGGAKYAVSNQQLAHLRCNQQKGVKTMRQVRALQNPQSKALRKRARLSLAPSPSVPSVSLADLLRPR
jgi:hypothetical protein